MRAHKQSLKDIKKLSQRLHKTIRMHLKMLKSKFSVIGVFAAKDYQREPSIE